MTARTRFAPSPTGMLHVGGARTALFCYLEARRQGGQYLLRIEDTDRERSTKEAVQVILDGLSWLGLDHDEGPFYQTLRFDRYREVAEQLMRAGKAYRCWCSRERLDAMREQQMAEGIKPRYDGLCRDRSEGVEGVTPVIRFRNPDSGEVVLDDRVRGRIVFNNEELDDLIIWRSDDTPTYNFCVVVDDVDMKITEVIRGDDHVNNTPRQINIYKALGAPLPVFAHVPMILGADGAKLSKRHGAVSVLQYREDGYLPQALLNYLVRLGWSHGDQEIFSMQEMISLFDIANVNKAASRFDYDKLAWLNQHYMKTLDPAEVAPHLVYQLKAAGLDPEQGPDPADVVRAMADRVKTLKEMAERARVWYAPLDGFEEAAAAKFLNAAAQAPLAAVRERLAALDRWTVESVHAALAEAAQALELGLGKVAQPMRVAATGTAVSPSIDHTIYLVGQARMLERIDAALAEIARRSAA